MAASSCGQVALSALLFLCSWVVLPASGQTEELTFPVEKLASEGRHALTIGRIDFGNYSFDTRGFDGGLPGPTFRMYPGDTLLITLINTLAVANNKACGDNDAGHFCETSVTNLHTHGLHVSSKGRRDGWSYSADDVFADVQPGESEDFRFEIPDYHMPGTHWYHPHHHHATALQAGGGAAGVLIVNDPPGYLPEIYSEMPERVLMFSAHNLQTLQDMARIADSNLLENAVAQAGDLPTNIFLVNGQSGPHMSLSSNTWYRFRMVFAAVEQSLHLTVTEVTNGASCAFQLMAKDGVYLHTFPRTVSTIYLFPGARADVAVSCTCVAYPCTAILGSSSTAARRLRGGTRRLQPKPAPADMGNAGQAPGLPAADVAADVNVMQLIIEEDVSVSTTPPLPSTTLERPCYVVDLRDVTVPAGNTGTLSLQGAERRVQWNGVGESMTHDNVHANGGTKYTWPPLTTFQAGTVYEINVVGAQVHPLHMHVNPYQITTLPGGPYGDNGYFQEGDWHDTLLIPELGPNNNLGIRLQTDRFTSKMVIHCHILEHEDEGMMAFIDIAGTEGASWPDAEVVDPKCLRSAFEAGENTTSSNSSDLSSTSSPAAASQTGRGVDIMTLFSRLPWLLLSLHVLAHRS